MIINKRGCLILRHPLKTLPKYTNTSNIWHGSELFFYLKSFPFWILA